MVTAITNCGIEYQMLHFIPRRKYGGGCCTWRKWRNGSPITGKGGYVIGTYSRNLYNICMREPRLLTDHRMILAELMGCVEQRNLK